MKIIRPIHGGSDKKAPFSAPDGGGSNAGIISARHKRTRTKTMRKRWVVPVVLILLLAVLWLLWRSPPDRSDTSSMDVIEWPPQTSYPGASFVIGIAPEPDTNGVADHGDVALSRDGKSRNTGANRGVTKSIKSCVN